MVKKCFSILLATLIMAEAFVPGMELHELSKLPALFQHYQNHKNQQPEITFLSFIELHYQDSCHHEQDSGTHHKLPFSSHQSQHNCCQQLAFHIAFIAVNPQLEPLHNIGEVIYTEPIVTGSHVSIWQPPKNA